MHSFTLLSATYVHTHTHTQSGVSKPETAIELFSIWKSDFIIFFLSF